MAKESWPVVVAGLEPLGLAVLHRLHALGVPVRALVTASERDRFGRELEALAIPITVGSPNSEADIGQLDLAACGALVLAANDAALNVDACLMVRRLAGDLPLIVRVADPTLVRFLRMSIPHVHVFSLGSTTAPVAADLAMHLLGEHHARPARTIRRRRPAVHRLPRASVLLLSLMAALLLTLVPAALYFTHALRVGFFDGFYMAWTSLVTAGQGNARFLRGPEELRAIAMALSIVGPLLLAGTVGIVVDWLLTRRFAGVVAVPVRMQDHVVIMGAGNEIGRASCRERVCYVV